jgi:hypothetical protein
MRFALMGAALVATAALVAPAAAQRVITNPGYCAQFYPNANCQNYGAGNPYTGGYRAGWRAGGSYAGMRYHRSWRHARYHHRRMHRMH